MDDAEMDASDEEEVTRNSDFFLLLARALRHYSDVQVTSRGSNALPYHPDVGIVIESNGELDQLGDTGTRSIPNSIQRLVKDQGTRYGLLHRTRTLCARPSIAHPQLRSLLKFNGVDTLTFTEFNPLRAWDIRKDEYSVLPTPRAWWASLVPISLASMGDVIYAGGMRGEVALFNIATGDAHIVYELSTDANRLMNGLFASHDDNARVLIASCNDQVVRFLDPDSLAVMSTQTYDVAINYAALWSNRMLAVAGDSTKVCISDARSHRDCIWLEDHYDHVFGLAWAPSGRYLATSAQDGRGFLYDMRNTSLPVAAIAHDSPMTSVKFTPDGRHIYYAGATGMIHVMEAATGAEVEQLEVDGRIAGMEILPRRDADGDIEACAVSFINDDMAGISLFEPVRDDTRSALIV